MIERFKKDIDKEIRLFLSDTRKRYKLHTVSGLLSSGIRDFLEREGKRIRPILFLTAYIGYTKRKKFSYKKLLRSSISFELLHDFLLIHDDVIDSSALRRGKPTLHRFFNSKLNKASGDKLGSDLAIVAGDVIFAYALESFMVYEETPQRKEKALRRLIEATVFTGAGEYLDIINGEKDLDKIGRKDVFLNYTMKTAKYTFEGPMLAGAELAGASAKEMKKLSGLGLCLGQAFQILDDLLDMFSTDREIGKPVLSDLNESKKTLLTWYAYRNLSGRDKRSFKRLFGKKKKTKKDLIYLKRLIEKTDSPLYCLKKLNELLNTADTALNSIKMKKESKAVIERMVKAFSNKILKLGIA